MRRRKKITAVHKANVLRVSENFFLDCVREVGARFPTVAYEEVIVDAMAAMLVRDASRYDVIVTTNMFGDILSDQASEISGSLGLAASINHGAEHGVAQAQHGSAPDIAGQDRANPTSLIGSAAMLLAWLGDRRKDNRLHAAAAAIESALDRAIADPQGAHPRPRRAARHQGIRRARGRHARRECGARLTHSYNGANLLTPHPGWASIRPHPERYPLNADLRRATRTDGSARTRDGIRYSYTLHGDVASPRRAALVHSVAMDRQFWQPVAERLAKDTAVVTFDCRGHGASDKPAGPYTVEQFADDIADLLTHARLGQDADRRRFDGRHGGARVRRAASGAHVGARPDRHHGVVRPRGAEELGRARQPGGGEGARAR